MSIRKVKEKVDKKRDQEKKARPDALHRAVIFLLEQAKMNNRDFGPEADHHMKTLDNLLGDKTELQLAAKSDTPAKAETPSAAPDAPQDEPPNTAALLRQSSRFRR